MTELTCELAESRIKPRASAPLVSLFVPTYNRVPEMVQTIESLAGQLEGGLEDKVEVLISDNGSGPEGREAIRALADRFDTVSFMANATDQGGHWQVYAAPWRVRGTYTWIFGSDDLMDPGGIGAVVRRLEADAPGFLGLDKQIWNRDLTRQLYATANGIPERTFDGFVDYFKGVGLHQIGFLGAAVEKTEAGRRIDPMRYLTADTWHNYAIAYFEKHQHSKCLYIPDAPIRRRLDNGTIGDYMGVIVSDVGMNFPILLADLAKPFGFTPEVFDQVNGSRFIDSYDTPRITLVDNIFEYLMRAIAVGRTINVFHKAAFEQMCAHWRPHRRAQFDDIWAWSEKMRRTTDAINESRMRYEQLLVDSAGDREELRKLALGFTDKKPA